MAEPYLSEIRAFGFDFPPRGWAHCDGQLLSITQNEALYSLLGTTYGGDGIDNFALPDLRGRVPIQVADTEYEQGAMGGAETVTLSEAELATHTHTVNAATVNANTKVFEGNVLAQGFSAIGNGAVPMYGPADNLTNLHPSTVTNSGGNQSHDNSQPTLTLSFCIAIQGIYPSTNSTGGTQ